VTDEPGSSIERRPQAGPGAPGRSATEIRADIERTRGELSASVDSLRARVAELTDWRRQLHEHREQIVAGAAVVGFAVGALVVARRLRRG
jgi:dienelactone hydrolase